MGDANNFTWEEALPQLRLTQYFYLTMILYSEYIHLIMSALRSQNSGEYNRALDQVRIRGKTFST